MDDKYHEQQRGINVNSFQSEAPKKEEYIVKVTDATSSLTENGSKGSVDHIVDTNEMIEINKTMTAVEWLLDRIEYLIEQILKRDKK